MIPDRVPRSAIQGCPAGYCPHDTASTGTEGCPVDLPGAPLSERAAHLYACQMLSTYKIAALTGIDRQRITRLLHEGGIQVKPSEADLAAAPLSTDT